MEAIKALAASCTNVQLDGKEEIFRNAVKVIRAKEIPEKVIEELLKFILPNFINRYYRYPRLKKLADNFIDSTSKDYPYFTLTSYANVVNRLYENYAYSSCKPRAILTQWRQLISLTFANADLSQLKNGEILSLAQAYSNLAYLIFTSDCSSSHSHAVKCLNRLIKKGPEIVDRFVVKIVESSSSNPKGLCFISAIFTSLKDLKQSALVGQKLPSVLEFYINKVLSAKSKSYPKILISCKSTFSSVDDDLFKSLLLPAILKYLLRNAECTTQAVGILLDQLTITLNDCALDLFKPIAAQLYSKDEQTQLEAAEAIKALSRKCTDENVISNLLACSFGILNGSDGKLSNAGQRIGVLNGIGNLSYHGASDNKSTNEIAKKACDFFISLLKNELHEATLLAALDALFRWCQRFEGDFSASLTNFFKLCLTLKSSSPAVAYKYLQLMNDAYEGDQIPSASPLVSTLLEVVEKAYKQPHLTVEVQKALPASILLLKMNAALNIDSNIKPFWNWIADKRLFLNDKFLDNLDAESNCLLVDLIQKIIYENPYKLGETSSQHYYQLLIMMLNSTKFYEVRRKAEILLRKLLSTVSGRQICLLLIDQFSLFFTGLSDRVIPQSGITEQMGDLKDHNYDPKIVAQSLFSCCKVPELNSEDADEICLKVLPLFCKEYIHDYKPYFLKLLDFYKQEPFDFVNKFTCKLMNEIESLELKTSLNCIELLSSIGCEKYFTESLLRFTSSLSPVVLNEVSVEEVLILNTPKGVLYDKSIVDAAKENTHSANIKRESKAYSYKEQMVTIALQKEIEEKKRKEGKLKDELTPKQKEAVQNQLQKEELIRKHIGEIWEPSERALLSLNHLISGNVLLARKHISHVQRKLWPLLKSPLAAPQVVDCLLVLKNACFAKNDKFTSDCLLYAMLRLEKTACELDKNWCQEDVINQSRRAFEIIHGQVLPNSIKRKMSVTSHYSTDSVDSSSDVEPRELLLPSFSFAFCFPLIKLFLTECRGSINEELACKLIEFCCVHTSLSNYKSDDQHLAAIPFNPVIKLMFNQISTTDVGGSQQAACRCILETVKMLAKLADNSLPPETLVSACQIAMENTLQPNSLVREYALQCMFLLVNWIKRQQVEGVYLEFIKHTYVSKFDVDESNQAIAEKIWKSGAFTVKSPDVFSIALLDDIVNPCEAVRESASEAISKFLEEIKASNAGKKPQTLQTIIAGLLTKISLLYEENSFMIMPVYDEFGRLVSEGGVDKWEARSGLALTLRKLCPYLPNSLLQNYFNIILPKGINDRSPNVSHLMLLAAVEGVKIHGKEEIMRLQTMLEKQFDEMPKDRSCDTLRHSLVVLLGTLAQHLNKDDPKIRSIVAKLIEALSTPSQLVQEAIANCLPPLVPAIKEQVPQLVEKLLCLLLEANQYGERKGAAFGLAGLVKGMGILSLRQLDIMTRLTDAVTDKKSAKHREGALLALEMLCNMLGKLFEPYVVHILPNLLICFGDQDQHVREAADECAKAIMRHLSIHGVKLVLPALMKGLDDDSWRTKCGSIELLGAMAYCAPKQLSSCLPNIVPKLIDVLSDTHLRVQKAGSTALKHIGQVIKNPEIQAIVKVLLGALEDPSRKTAECLQTLLNTKFVHYIDAPSLALIMPVIHRALDDRSTDTRRSAARIVGSIYSLTDQKDVEPYLPQIIPGLKRCLLDPVPDVRSVAAKALGAMIGAAGQIDFQDLVPWLKSILTSVNSSVDRSGGAQGLSEVIGGLGEAELNKNMPDIIQTAERQDVEPHVKDGYIMMYVYLPTVFGNKFLPYLPKIVPSILSALADENEYVRETALKAGQRMINTYCENAIPLLLPSLQLGLFNDNWRIRYSSVQLLGDLLYKISGVTGKMSTESGEDETFGTEALNKVILDALGIETRNKVLSGVYICRSDVALSVRTASAHIWKLIVSNTPKTVKEILPTLFQLLLGCLASPSYDKQQVGARTLGELVKKIGERILIDVVPVLESGLKSDDADQRQGVCIALSEIMANTSKETVLLYSGNLLPSIKMALTDPLPEVRSAAASTFGVLHTTIGPEAMSQVLTPLLDQLDDPKIGAYVLDGLKQVMAVKSKVVLPYMIPKLTAGTVNTKALAHLATVAGESLNKHLGKIFSPIVTSLSLKLCTDKQPEEMENAVMVLDSVIDESGSQLILDVLLQRHYESKQIEIASAILLSYFVQNSKVPLNDSFGQIIRGCLNFYTSEDKAVICPATEALSSIVKSMESKDQIERLPDFRQTIQTLALSYKQNNELLPGFCDPKAIQPVLTVLREGVLNGPSESKEYAANGLSEMLPIVDPLALKPHVVNVTGPLIRVLGDRYPPNVKSSILISLSLLLDKASAMLKPFLPQLQSTFLKTLSEPSSKLVRNKAAVALSKLIDIHPKPDTVFTELCKNVKIVQDEAVRESYLTSIKLCLPAAKDKLTADLKSTIESIAKSYVNDNDENVRSSCEMILETLSA